MNNWIKELKKKGKKVTMRKMIQKTKKIIKTPD